MREKIFTSRELLKYKNTVDISLLKVLTLKKNTEQKLMLDCKMFSMS